MKGKTPLLGAALVLVGLGLGATLLRDQVPLGGAQTSPGQAVPATRAQTEAGARLQNERNTMDIVRRYEPGLVFISTEQEVVRHLHDAQLILIRVDE